MDKYEKIKNYQKYIIGPPNKKDDGADEQERSHNQHGRVHHRPGDLGEDM